MVFFFRNKRVNLRIVKQIKVRLEENRSKNNKSLKFKRGKHKRQLSNTNVLWVRLPLLFHLLTCIIRSFWQAFGYLNNSSNWDSIAKQADLTPEKLLDTENIVNEIKLAP